MTPTVVNSSPVRQCKPRQLELTAGLRDGAIAVLGYGAGRACRLRPGALYETFGETSYRFGGDACLRIPTASAREKVDQCEEGYTHHDRNCHNRDGGDGKEHRAFSNPRPCVTNLLRANSARSPKARPAERASRALQQTRRKGLAGASRGYLHSRT